METDSFKVRFCERYGVPPAAFGEALLRRALYPHARPLCWFLGMWDRHYFQPDFEFIEDVAHLRSAAYFAEAMDCYINHPYNRRFLRRRLRLRISGRRMWEEVNAIFPIGTRGRLATDLRGAGSVEPFLREPRPPINPGAAESDIGGEG